jgi:membrane associated rhomboid family serine protease
MFLHAGWAHTLGNMLFLFVFGNHVERAMGPARYLIFYLVCGLGASALETLTAWGSDLPGLGASGAISGVLAAYLMLYPTSRFGTLIPLCTFLLPARIPAWIFIVLWFLVQLVSGLMSLSGPGSAAGDVAYFAHVGGFILGLVLVRLFTKPALLEPLQAYQGGPS